MSAHLSRLAIFPSDVSHRQSISSAPMIRMRFAEGEKDDEDASSSRLSVPERDKLGALMHDCQYDWTVCMPNFDARCGELAPPTGYVAIMHEDTTFRMDMIDRALFRGASFADLGGSRGRFSDAEIQRALGRMNQFVREVSPLPAKLGSEPWEWVCALGPNAWIGVYERRQEGRVSYSLGVVAGMEDGMYDDFFRTMRSRFHGKAAVQDAMPVLDQYRRLVKENRTRLLDLLLGLLEGCVSACPRAAPTQAYAREPTREKSIRAEAWAWVPPTPFRVPVWYAFPSRAPRDCAQPLPAGLAAYPFGTKMTEEEIEARGERAPVSLVPSLDVTMDDLKRYERSIKEHVVRYAGCADVYVSVRGPLHPIHVNPVLPGPAKTYRGVPAQARHVRGGGGETAQTTTTAVPHTWEDDRVVANRLARATYGPHVDPPAASSGHVEWKHEEEEEEEEGVKEHEKETPPPANLSFYPVFVRVSCVDGDGYVSEPSEKYRISGFGVDAWRGL